MKVPNDRKYSETHEWYLLDGEVVTMGITQYAADELTDITFVDLPEVGTRLTAGDQIGEVESVKATADIYTSISGSVIQINETLADHPELVNEDAFEEGWLIKIRPDSLDPLAALLDAKEYRAFVRNVV